MLRLTSAFLLVFLLLGSADELPWEYPFGPWADPEDARVATRFERALALPTGTARAIRQLCVSDPMSMTLEDRVASNYLLKHADRTLPLLLDMMARAERAPESWLESQCADRAEVEVLQAICFGYDIGGSGPTYDAHPLAVERRSRAQRALVAALKRGRRRGEMAMDVLLQAGPQNLCPGSHDVMRAATPMLVERLGVPRVPATIPGSEYNAVDTWERALRALSYPGVDRTIAEARVIPFLNDDRTAPLAILALARMDADVSALVPQLARVLDQIAADADPAGSIDSARRTQLTDTLAALSVIGAPARAALPNLASIVSRVEAPKCLTLGAVRYVDVVRAVAGEADGREVVECLVPLLQCSGPSTPIVELLGRSDEHARAPLLTVLRDPRRTIHERLAAVEALGSAGQLALAAEDRRLVALLRAKLTNKAELRAAHNQDLYAGTAAELRRCRSEAGLDALEPQTERVTWGFANCITEYLCGPERETYWLTMAHCCRVTDTYPRPQFCPAP